MTQQARGGPGLIPSHGLRPCGLWAGSWTFAGPLFSQSPSAVGVDPCLAGSGGTFQKIAKSRIRVVQPRSQAAESGNLYRKPFGLFYASGTHSRTHPSVQASGRCVR